MKNNKGFSLVELIVVIAIMAILAAVAVVGFSAYIQKARNAADTEYISNVLYFTELFATENQVAVDSIHLPKDKVDNVEDIKVWVIDPATGELTLKDYTQLPWIQDIYDGVGDWEFIGDLEFDNIDGVNGGNTSDGNDDGNGGNAGDGSCGGNHPVASVEVLVKRPATCQVTGVEYKHCNACGADYDETTIPVQNHNYQPIEGVKITGFIISRCDWCNDKQIKNENNLPIVPVG